MHYSPAELWVLIALLALVTLGARSFFVLLPRRWQPRGRVEQALRHAPLAALLAAYFSDRGRPFQADRGRQIGVAVGSAGEARRNWFDCS